MYGNNGNSNNNNSNSQFGNIANRGSMNSSARVGMNNNNPNSSQNSMRNSMSSSVSSNTNQMVNNNPMRSSINPSQQQHPQQPQNRIIQIGNKRVNFNDLTDQQKQLYIQRQKQMQMQRQRQLQMQQQQQQQMRNRGLSPNNSTQNQNLNTSSMQNRMSKNDINPANRNTPGIRPDINNSIDNKPMKSSVDRGRPTTSSNQSINRPVSRTASNNSTSSNISENTAPRSASNQQHQNPNQHQDTMEQYRKRREKAEQRRRVIEKNIGIAIEAINDQTRYRKEYEIERKDVKAYAPVKLFVCSEEQTKGSWQDTNLIGMAIFHYNPVDNSLALHLVNILIQQIVFFEFDVLEFERQSDKWFSFEMDSKEYISGLSYYGPSKEADVFEKDVLKLLEDIESEEESLMKYRKQVLDKINAKKEKEAQSNLPTSKEPSRQYFDNNPRASISNNFLQNIQNKQKEEQQEKPKISSSVNASTPLKAPIADAQREPVKKDSPVIQKTNISPQVQQIKPTEKQQVKNEEPPKPTIHLPPVPQANQPVANITPSPRNNEPVKHTIETKKEEPAPVKKITKKKISTEGRKKLKSKEPKSRSKKVKPLKSKDKKKSKKTSLFGKLTGMFVDEDESEKKRRTVKIGGVKKFEHKSHIGYDSERGFYGDVPPKLIEIFKKAGITEEELKDEKTLNFAMKSYNVITEKQKDLKKYEKPLPSVPPSFNTTHNNRSNTPPKLAPPPSLPTVPTIPSASNDFYHTTGNKSFDSSSSDVKPSLLSNAQYQLREPSYLASSNRSHSGNHSLEQMKAPVMQPPPSLNTNIPQPPTVSPNHSKQQTQQQQYDDTYQSTPTNNQSVAPSIPQPPPTKPEKPTNYAVEQNITPSVPTPPPILSQKPVHNTPVQNDVPLPPPMQNNPPVPSIQDTDMNIVATKSPTVGENYSTNDLLSQIRNAKLKKVTHEEPVAPMAKEDEDDVVNTLSRLLHRRRADMRQDEDIDDSEESDSEDSEMSY